ncbi:peptidase [Sphingomonas sp. IBVSS1]|nr:peptidase [Sphingomonas sp. IBVSS1]
MKLQISSSLHQNLLDWAAASPAVEICGLLVGRGNCVERLVPARNVAPDPARSFEIDPASLLSVHREMRASGQQVIGHWHSHPNGRAEPSARDAARALDNGQIWLILAGGGATAWQARSSGPGPARFEAVTLELC